MTSLQNQIELRHPESRAFETRPFAKWLTKPLVLLCIAVVVLLSRGEAAWCNEVLIKNITDVEGDRTSPLTGFGLVAGLNGTGGKTPLTREAAVNLMQRFGIRSDPILRMLTRTDTQLKTDNISAVLVTADLRTSDRPGRTLDVTVAALDDAASLQGGTLIMTPLYGADEEVYAVASGTVSIGGFSFSGDAASVVKNHPTKGTGQARVEKQIPYCVKDDARFRLMLRDADPTTATRIVDAINELAPYAARTLDAGTVEVHIPIKYQHDRQRFIGMTQLLPVSPSSRARVVINEATGTIIIGADVKLSRVALAHANLSIITGETPEVSQPAPLSDGETVVVPRTDLEVVEETNRLSVFEPNVTVGDLAQALNALGVSPRDLGSIFLQLRAQGALHAELIIK